MCTTSWTSFREKGLRAQLKHDPFIASNRHEKCSYGKYEFKDEKQTKLAPTGPVAQSQRHGDETSAAVH